MTIVNDCPYVGSGVHYICVSNSKSEQTHYLNNSNKQGFAMPFLKTAVLHPIAGK